MPIIAEVRTFDPHELHDENQAAGTPIMAEVRPIDPLEQNVADEGRGNTGKSPGPPTQAIINYPPTKANNTNSGCEPDQFLDSSP